MRKPATVFTIISLSLSLTSCDECLLMAIIGGLYGDIGAGLACLQNQQKPVEDLVRDVDNAMHGSDPSTASTGDEETQPARDRTAFKSILMEPLFTAGPSLSWLRGDKEDSETFPPKPGFQMGAIWQVPVGDKLTIEPGLMYSNRGLGYKMEESGVYEPGVPGGSYSYSYEQKKRLHYMEVPLFVSGSVANGLDLYGGPQVGFLLAAKVVNETNGEVTSTEKGTDGFKKVDLGIAAGLRYAIPNS
ncbi:MAG: hypothetical protein C0490_28120, partial [Marivirga sp.]|nr:hypothetical protein [Marivirga sp.]